MTTHPADNAPAHELLPCPFCGSAPYSDEDDSHSTAWEIKCSCGAAPYVWEITKAEAVIAWNTRTAPEPASEVARLRLVNALISADGFATFAHADHRTIVFDFANNDAGLNAFEALSAIASATANQRGPVLDARGVE